MFSLSTRQSGRTADSMQILVLQRRFRGRMCAVSRDAGHLELLIMGPNNTQTLFNKSRKVSVERTGA